MKLITYYLKSYFYLLSVLCITPRFYSQSITTGTPSPTLVCRGSSITVPFVTSGSFQEGGSFKLQLSNRSGNFNSNNYIGVLNLENGSSGNNSVSRSITGQIQSSISTGNAYRVRVVFFDDDENLLVVGNKNNKNIRIVSSNLTPSFSLPTSICSGTNLTLPTTSTNSITGTWSPAFNPTQTTTYSFTPTAGFCANTVTRTITVNEKATPTFTLPTSICSGTNLTLPTTSTNSITGTWSPAFNPTQTTTYTFTPTAGTCASASTMTVVVNSLVTPIFNQVPPICEGGTFELQEISENGINGTWSPALNNATTTTYNFSPTAGTCASASTMTVVVNSLVTPIFNQFPPICEGGTFELQEISENGINGSWSPALNNTATTAYTFTPAEGSCASTSTMTVVVNSLVTPTFEQVSPICFAESISDFPETSTNGIAGSWSPPVINNHHTTTYTFTPNQNSCASIVTQTLVVKPITSIDTTVTAIFTYTWPVNGETYTESGVYTYINNCIETKLNLTIVQNCNLETPSVITGTSIGLCLNGITNPTYTIDAINGASSYEWISPEGTEIISGQGTTAITLNILANFTEGNLSVRAINICDTSASKVLYIRSVYYTPLTPTGTTTGLCPQGTVTSVYTAALVSGVINYSWSAPEGTTIISGQGTNIIELTISENFSIGNLKLTMNNSCGASPERVVILRSILTQPGLITGTTIGLCPQGIATSSYSISAQTGVTGYTWTAPLGTVIQSGQGTTSIVLEILDGFTVGNLCVVANNACGNSIPRTLSIRSTLTQPGLISGPTTGLCSQGVSTATYTIATVTGATSYTWTAPIGTSIISGQGSNSIELSILEGFTNGSLSVVANNSCGSGSASTLSIRSTLSQLGSISGMTIGLCSQGTPLTTYSVTAQAGATSYTWTAPTGTSIVSGQGTNSIVLSILDNFTLGNLSVVSNNQCGASLVRTSSLFSTPSIPGTITGTTNNLCPNGINNPTYTIATVSGATSYTWIAPAGTTIVSGQGTTSVTLDITSSFVAGNISVVANNACGSSNSRVLALSSSIAAPTLITGTTSNLCPNGVNNPTYTISAVSGALSYTWTAPAGTTITSGQGTTSITLEITDSFITGTLSVVTNNACGSSSPKTLALSSTITAPGTITGTVNNLCPNGVNNPTYSIAAVSGATSYTWTAPTGATIISGQGTTTVTLEITNSFISGNISVIANNACGSSTPKTLALTSTITAPVSISGTINNLCPNGVNNPTYSITAVAGATSYTWTAPTGATIISGQGTTSITLDITSSFVSGNLSVVANNACGSSAARTLALSSSPLIPGSITGSINNLCPEGISSPTYTIAAVAGATSYVWTAPAGTTIVSGQGTRTIKLSISSSFTSGAVTVAASNLCGTGPSKSLSIYSVPLTPTSITGSTTPCGTATYTCATVAQAISYTWTVPTGIEIVSGQGTNSIQVNIIGSSIIGNITVKASNNCKTGNARSLAINSCSSVTKMAEIVTDQTINDLEVAVYPNPTNDYVNVQFSNEVEENLNIEVVNLIGQKVAEVEIQKGYTNVNTSLEGMPAGIYLLKIKKSDNNIIHTTKILKQ